MSDLGDGLLIAERLRELDARLAQHMEMHLAHEASDGAHAAAFSAHGQSPGPVENAEELASSIVVDATDVVGDAVDVVADAGSEAVEAVGDAGEAAVDAIEDAAEEVAEATDDAAVAVSEEVPVGAGERVPERGHFLQRKIW